MFEKNGNRPITIFTTFPDVDSAKKFAHMIVSENLAACVNIVKGIESIYRWEEKICIDAETMLIIKSNNKNFKHLKSLLLKAHPYELPECIMLEISDGHQPYLDWLTSVGE